MAIIEAYSTCDMCGKKFVTEINDEVNETREGRYLWIQKDTGIYQYDICQSCLNGIELINDGREVILTTRRLV